MFALLWIPPEKRPKYFFFCFMSGADFFLAVYQDWNFWHTEDTMIFKMVLYLFLFAIHSLAWFMNQSERMILNAYMLVACSWLNNRDTVDFIWNCLSWECWLEIHTQKPRLRLYQWYCTEQLFSWCFHFWIWVWFGPTYCTAFPKIPKPSKANGPVPLTTLVRKCSKMFVID